MALNKHTLSIVALTASWVLASGPAIADSAESRCNLWQDDEHLPARSGDCVFSQRQGYIGITLSDDSRIDLTPIDYMTYRDDEDRPVQRSVDEDGKNTFIWDSMKLELTFGRAENAEIQ
jgi:hypothetical protein